MIKVLLLSCLGARGRDDTRVTRRIQQSAAPRLRQATATEVAAVALPSQRPSANGSCAEAFKHICFGAARSGSDLLADEHLRRGAELVPDDGSRDTQPLDGLARLLGRVVEAARGGGPDTLTIVGDSVSSDFWGATVAAARLVPGFVADLSASSGFFELGGGLCGAGLGFYLDGEPHARCDARGALYRRDEPCGLSGVARLVFDDVKRRGGVAVKLRVVVKLRIVIVTKAPPPDVAACLDDAAVLVLNAGAHANSRQDYDEILADVASPFLSRWAAARDGAPALWLETLPQHFPSDASGLYVDGLSSSSDSCRPFTNRTAANWRNAHFADWLAQRPSLAKHNAIAAAFDAFAPLYHLHREGDCTHYAYSPFSWTSVWRSAADALDGWPGRRRSLYPPRGNSPNPA